MFAIILSYVLLYGALFGAFLLLHWLLFKYNKTGETKTFLKFYSVNLKLGARNYITIFILAVFSICAFLLLQQLATDFLADKNVEGNVELALDNFGAYLVYVVIICALPAFVEELIFRGLIFNFVKNMSDEKKIGVWFPILISAVCFAIFHWNFYQTIYQFILGVILAFVVYRAASLFAGMVLHFLNNFLVLSVAYIFGSSSSPLIWNAGTITCMISLALVGGLTIYTLTKTLKGAADATRN
jgi:membrane protease YdiL (CAAX protease family)